jgi:dTDP-4-dehydrorhamnose 3,5-epimerase-like enzyme
MTSKFLIRDVHLLLLKAENGRLVVLRDNDHLLRRFGQVEVCSLPAGSIMEFTVRAEADEVWAPVEGKAEFTLVDTRAGSPSENQSVTVVADARTPQALLVPFGVAYSIVSESGARLLRIATHADNVHADDQTLSQDAISARSAA